MNNNINMGNNTDTENCPPPSMNGLKSNHGNNDTECMYCESLETMWRLSKQENAALQEEMEAMKKATENADLENQTQKGEYKKITEERKIFSNFVEDLRKVFKYSSAPSQGNNAVSPGQLNSLLDYIAEYQANLELEKAAISKTKAKTTTRVLENALTNPDFSDGNTTKQTDDQRPSTSNSLLGQQPGVPKRVLSNRNKNVPKPLGTKEIQKWKCLICETPTRFQFFSKLKSHMADKHKSKNYMGRQVLGCGDCGHLFQNRNLFVKHRPISGKLTEKVSNAQVICCAPLGKGNFFPGFESVSDSEEDDDVSANENVSPGEDDSTDEDDSVDEDAFTDEDVNTFNYTPVSDESEGPTISQQVSAKRFPGNAKGNTTQQTQKRPSTDVPTSNKAPRLGGSNLAVAVQNKKQNICNQSNRSTVKKSALIPFPSPFFDDEPSSSGSEDASMDGNEYKHKLLGKIYKCTCGQYCADKNYFINHIKNVSGGEHCRCVVCWQSFKFYPQLENHMGVVHKKELEKFECAECASKFKDLIVFRQHFKDKHVK